MIVRCLTVGPFAENSYVVGCEETHEGALVDPGGEVDDLLAAARKDRLEIRKILLTHGHWDHIFGVGEAKRRTGAKVWLHRTELKTVAWQGEMAEAMGLPAPEKFEVDEFLKEGEDVSVGRIAFRVRFVPGHAPGHVAFTSKTDAFVGDTLMAGGMGRYDLPGGDLAQLLVSIRGTLMALDDSVRVHSGHGPSTTIGRERRSNPYVLGSAL